MCLKCFSRYKISGVFEGSITHGQQSSLGLVIVVASFPFIYFFVIKIKRARNTKACFSMCHTLIKQSLSSNQSE